MRFRSLVAALLAATSFVASPAFAQDADSEGSAPERRIERAGRAAAERNSDGGNWDRGAAMRSAPMPAPEQSAPPEMRAPPEQSAPPPVFTSQPISEPRTEDGNSGGGGWRGRQPDAPMPAPIFRSEPRTEDGAGGGGRGGGNRRGGGAPDVSPGMPPALPVAVAPAPARDGDGDRRADRRGGSDVWRGNGGQGDWRGTGNGGGRGGEGGWPGRGNGATPPPPPPVIGTDPGRGDGRGNGGQGWGRRGNDGRGNDGRGQGWNWGGRGHDGRGGNDGWRGQDYRRNDGWRNDTWRNDTWRNDSRRNDTWRNDTWRNDSGRYGNLQRWDRNWRNDRRYDWQRYRQYNRDFFRQDRYYAPYGYNYGYRRFSVGIYLGSAFYAQSYWLDDPYEYRLPQVYPPYRWVRYYNDVLLVDTRTGMIVDVINDFFW